MNKNFAISIGILMCVWSVAISVPARATDKDVNANADANDILAFNWNIWQNQPVSGSLSGKAVYIGQGGELMPARSAKLYIIRNEAGKPRFQSLVDKRYENENLNLIVNHIMEDIAKHGGNLTSSTFSSLVMEQMNSQDSSAYIAGKLYYSVCDVIKETIKNDISRFCVGRRNEASTDLEGNFSYVRIPFGNYSLVLVGRAGDHDHIWEKDFTVYC